MFPPPCKKCLKYEQKLQKYYNPAFEEYFVPLAIKTKYRTHILNAHYAPIKKHKFTGPEFISTDNLSCSWKEKKHKNK